MPADLVPPTAAIRPRPITQHDETRVDNYFWLRERDNPEVLKYLQDENTYTEAMMAYARDLREQLFVELRGRIKETDSSVPEKRGDFFYYTRTEAGQQYPIYCRRRGSLEGAEERLLDQNALSGGQPFCSLGMFRVSPDHLWLAYSIDYSGSEKFTLHFKNLLTGEVLPEQIPNTYYALEWANDSRTVFYTTLDSALRPHELHRHSLGADPAQDGLLYHEADESFFTGLNKSSSEAYLFLTLRSTTTTEVHYLPADTPAAAFALFQSRRHKIEYWLAHHGDLFFILTNDGAPNFKLQAVPVADPGRRIRREFLPHRPNSFLESILVFERWLVRLEREGGLQRIRVTDLDGSNPHEVEFPEPVYAYEIDANAYQDFRGQTLRLAYDSPVTPRTVVDYGLADGSWVIRKQQEIPSGHDPALYEAVRLTATAGDGTPVPLSVVCRKGLKRNGRNPALLYGYGSYGHSLDPHFNANRLSLLDRGFVFAIAHIRGGSEMGRAWYEGGRMLNKKNTFTDFVACAEHLVAEGFTAPDKLACQGRSAGGLLMGAVVNLRPDLFRAVIAEVPFVDVVNSISDPAIPLTVIEWEQWGNPAILEEFQYMRSYSPYDNVEAKDYPNLLVTAGLNDPRVAYWEPAKWTAKLRALKTDTTWLLLKTNLAAGHGGSSGRYDYLKEIAFSYAFLIDRLGVPA